MLLERMTLKHKTQGKWAKDMIKHGMSKDKETRDEMEEMLKQGERLRSKILGHDEDEESDNNASDLEQHDEDLDSKDQHSERENVGKTGVLNMAFMRNAEARERDQNKEQLQRLKSMENGEDTGLIEDSESLANKTFNKGRRVYAPGSTEARADMKALDQETLKEIQIDDSKSLTNRLSKSNTKVSVKAKSAKAGENKASETQANPWINDSDDEEYVKKSSKVHLVDQDSSKSTKSAHKISKEMAKQSKKKSKKSKDEELLLDLEDRNSLNIVAVSYTHLDVYKRQNIHK